MLIYKRTLSLFILTFFAVLSAPSYCPAQEPDGTPVQSYDIGIEDILEISVWQHEELNKLVKVRPDGKITFSLIGDIHVLGMSAMEIDKVISDKLSQFIRDPEVTVIVSKINSKKVILLGEIGAPGIYIIEVETHLMELITKAGGPRPTASLDDISIIEDSGAIKKVNLEKFINHGDLSSNIIIKAGSTIIVPRNTMNQVTLLGNVSSPGNYPMSIGTGMTLFSLLIQAGGPKESADLTKISVIRKNEGTSIINFYDAFFKGDTKNDVPLKSGDIVMVPIGQKSVIVVGEVEKPGIFPILKQPVTVLEMVTQAGYLSEKGKLSGIHVIRTGENGKPEVKSINLNAVVKSGKLAKDIEVLPGDIIYVPKRFLVSSAQVLSDILPYMYFLVSTNNIATLVGSYTK